jgi:hypothetical protein
MAPFVSMEEEIVTLQYDVEKAIDFAFQGKFILNFYQYLQSNNAKRRHAEQFIDSTTAASINSLVLELDEYLKGGQDPDHKLLREAYGHIPKPQARKIKEYLYGILQDAWRYSHDKRPGRRKKSNK